MGDPYKQKGLSSSLIDKTPIKPYGRRTESNKFTGSTFPNSMSIKGTKYRKRIDSESEPDLERE